MPILSTHNLTKHFDGITAVNQLSLSFELGKITGIVGPNGSGKTTLLKLMIGLIKPGQGEIKLFGTPLSEFKDWHKLGYVSQKAVNFDPLFPVTVWEVLYVIARSQRLCSSRRSRPGPPRIPSARSRRSG